MPAARPMKRAGPRSWRDRKRPARCSGWRSIPTVCGYIMMTMAVDVASRAGAHQPGFRRHVNTFPVAIALEQFDKATVNGRARRSEERRVGDERVSKGRSRWSQYL